jgi:hypothetical protein
VCEQLLISHDRQTATAFGAKQETVRRNFSVGAGGQALSGEIVLLNSTARLARANPSRICYARTEFTGFG